MDRRTYLLTIATPVLGLTGCLSGGSTNGQSGSPAEQSGSGNPCGSPRNIDYDAVEAYRDNGVYLENATDQTLVACVTITRTGTATDDDPDGQPIVTQMGYEMHPDKAVELHRFGQAGRYVVEIALEATTERHVITRSESALTDDDAELVIFVITAADAVAVQSATPS